MSTKTFCDVCDVEITDDAMVVPTQADRTFRRLPKPITVTVQIQVVAGQTDAENLCHACLFRVVDFGPRPKALVEEEAK